MIKQTFIIFALVIATALLASHVVAAEQQEQIYGSQLMTQQEREDYRAQLRAAKTAEERERIRKAHHEQMKERARAHGITLPDEPPVHGKGMGPGAGTGSGGGRGR